MSLKFSAHDLTQNTVATLAFITAGSFLGFLPWNFYPQKIMPGYSGKTLAGFLIATIAILSGGKVGSALIILSIPMLDAIYILIKRILLKKSPFKADRNHLHHKLLDLGWSKRKIALFYWIISTILGLVALLFTSQQKLFIFILMAIFLGGIFIWFSTNFLVKNK
jgi:UDP-GlcNAc:undecaprenyl-phosphate/decaprenyl-phosphate GlcNAc-1-phosphate transferase